MRGDLDSPRRRPIDVSLPDTLFVAAPKSEQPGQANQTKDARVEAIVVVARIHRRVDLLGQSRSRKANGHDGN